jgi:curved DNA-binding protein CbpA
LEVTWYFVVSGAVLVTLVSTVFSPFHRKRAIEDTERPPAPQESNSTSNDGKVAPLGDEDRLNNAIRHWASVNATVDTAPGPSEPAPPVPPVLSETTAFQNPVEELVLEPETAEAGQPNTSIAEPNTFFALDFENAPNFYEILQISPRADLDTIHRVYRIMAARCHPDNPLSGDHERFLQLQEAYDVLSDPYRRSQYDMALRLREMRPLPIFGTRMFADGLDGETNRRFGVLALLYQQRRLHQGVRGISVLDIEQRMSVPREHLEFTLWYLRLSGFIQVLEDNSDYAITVAGVNHLESNVASNSILRDILVATAPATSTLLSQASARKSQRDGRSKTRRSRRPKTL